MQSVCDTYLKDSSQFSAVEMQDPVLVGRQDVSNPCTRRGILSYQYYTQIYSRAATRIEALLIP